MGIPSVKRPQIFLFKFFEFKECQNVAVGCCTWASVKSSKHQTAFSSLKRILTALKGNKIRRNALRADLSRRQQGFKSPWGRQ